MYFFKFKYYLHLDAKLIYLRKKQNPHGKSFIYDTNNII